MVNDPVGDMLTRIRNAQMRRRNTVSTPGSTLRARVLDVLKSEGYIDEFRVEDNSDRPGSTLHITMRYSPERLRTISGIQRVSKPGLRVYRKSKEIPRVLGGLGVAVVSTSQGLLTDREARKRNVGGEVLCFVW